MSDFPQRQPYADGEAVQLIGHNNKKNVISGSDDAEVLKGQKRNDILAGSGGEDWLYGKQGKDILLGDNVPDKADFDKDGQVTINSSSMNDYLFGNGGEDTLIDQFGSDGLIGGKGNDLIISMSDSNIPEENQNIPANVDDGDDLDRLDFSDTYVNPDNLSANDTLEGEKGADTFSFQLLINASKEIVEKHTNDQGVTNWGMNGVAGENNNYHDHWVEGIGHDTIIDFNAKEGDSIKVFGHTVQKLLLENDENSKTAVIGLYSDQGNDGQRGGGAHDLDVLGKIEVRYKGKFDFDSDVTVKNEDYGAYGLDSNAMIEEYDIPNKLDLANTSDFVGTNGDDEIEGNLGKNKIQGLQGNDRLIGQGGKDKLEGSEGDDHLIGDDIPTEADYNAKGVLDLPQDVVYDDKLFGDTESDILADQYGNDRLTGGDGDDRLISISDSSIPSENTKIPAGVDDGNDLDKLDFSNKLINQYGTASKDILTGGSGADTFEWNLLINASKEIVQKHTNDDEVINWGMNGVAGENNNYHDHWVDGIGWDLITDFSGQGGQNDQIIVRGHTVKVKLLSKKRKNAKLGIYSDQGNDGERGNGAHDFDVLGTIVVKHDGNFNFDNDVQVVGVDYGAYGNGAELDEVFGF